VRAGADLVIAAGGDGTASEVVSGILGAGLGGYAEVALLPLGTGGDLARTLGLAGSVDDAITRIRARKGAKGSTPAARIFVARAGREITTHFINIRESRRLGLVTQLVNEHPRPLVGACRSSSAPCAQSRAGSPQP